MPRRVQKPLDSAFNRLRQKFSNCLSLCAAHPILFKVLILIAWLGLVKYWGILFLIFSCIVAIFFNLTERRGGHSAYSVFNENQRHLMGDLRASQIDAELRQGANGISDSYESSNVLEFPEAVPPALRLSKNANKPCPCGSGKKFKRCCGSVKM